VSIRLQIICFIFSFLYGGLVYLFYKFNKRFIIHANLVSSFCFYFLMSYLVVITYIVVFFFLNKGNFHIYFLILLLFGLIFSRKVFK